LAIHFILVLRFWHNKERTRVKELGSMWYVRETIGEDVDDIKACYLVLGTKNSVHLCPHSVTILVSLSHVEE
jgi:hypothetical protein